MDWSDRVANARAMANGAAKNQCMTDMMDEALPPNVMVHQSTNTAGSIGAAITAGRYRVGDAQ
jgi:activator of 2-hydroxyglutaryl-CoA dehydratase